MFKQTQKVFRSSGILNKYFSTNPFAGKNVTNSHQNAIRFENQNRIWTFGELEQHSSAFAYGLVEMGYRAGDKLLLWVEKSHNAEAVAAQIGAGKAGVTLVTSYANSAEQLEKDLSSSKARGILYSPNSAAAGENQRYSDLVGQVVPELEQNGSVGNVLNSKKFSNLKYVVHTGFYSQPGQYKFRDVLVYASKNFNSLALPKPDIMKPFIQSGDKTYSISDLIGKCEQLRSTHKLENKTVFVAGDARSPVSFALGALNTSLHGSYSVYTGQNSLQQVGKTLELHQNAVLALDSDLVQNVDQLGWEARAQQALSEVAVINRSSQQASNAQSLFGEIKATQYGQAL